MKNVVPREYERLKPTQKNGTRRNLAHWGDTTKNFFVTIGCSMTYGVGINYKDCWSNLLAENFQMEHINLSFNGSSIEYQSDTINLFWQLLPQAKFCVWMLTLPTRSHNPDTSISDQERRMHDHSEWKDTATWNKIIDYCDKHSNQNLLCVNSWFYPQPYIKMLNGWFKNKKKFYVNSNDAIDFGDDNRHPGKKTHKKLSIDLISHIKKNFPQWIVK